jgi:hypothetical protein
MSRTTAAKRSPSLAETHSSRKRSGSIQALVESLLVDFFPEYVYFGFIRIKYFFV